MAYIFYFLQLVSPSAYQGMGSTPPIQALESVYASGDTRVAQSKEMAYRESQTCLALSLYWESKGETKHGMILVGLVILNRVRDKSYPNTVCGVVRSKHAFSYYWDGKSDVPKELDRYKLAQSIAKELLNEKHSGKIPPSVLWFKVCSYESLFFSKLRLHRIYGNHCYYYNPKR